MARLRRHLLLLLTFLALHASAATAPRIVFILADDLGYADTGPYGAKDIRTPHIDRLAREGVRFTDFYANAPVCTPTRCAFITGRYQQRQGLEWAMGYTSQHYRREGDAWVLVPDIHGVGLPATVPTLPKALQATGMATGAVGKWHLGYRDEFNPLHHGFDEYFGVLAGHSDYYTHHYYDGTPMLRDGLRPVQREGYLTDLFNQRAEQFIRTHGQQPFFLYVPHLAAHSPYQPPDKKLPAVTKATLDQGTRADYAAMVERLDTGVGMILAALEQQGILDDTLVVFSSDNGGAHLADNRPLFHRKTSLWEGGIRVPCIMRWPARLPKGVTTAQVGITMDLSATFAAIAGAQLGEGLTFDGINLIPHLTGERPIQERTLCWRMDSVKRMQKVVRHGKWKYVYDANVELLYDLSTDIGERNDLYPQHQDIVADLRARHAAWEAELAATARPQYLVK